MENTDKNYPEFLEKRIGLDYDEKVVGIFRKHWYVFRDPFLIGFFIPFVLVFLSIFLSSYLFIAMESFMSFMAKICLYLSPLAFVVGFLTFIYRLFLWSKTFYIVTDRRLIAVKQNNIFSLEVKQMTLDKIQDVTYQIEGMQANLYGYGDVEVQSASKDTRLVLTQVGTPHKVQKVIIEAASHQTAQRKLSE